MKVLVICSNLCYPYIEMSGNKAIYALLQGLSGMDGVAIDVLSYITEDGKAVQDYGNLKFHYLKAGGLFEFRLLAYKKALSFIKGRYDIVHDFSSLPLLGGLTGVLGKSLKARSVHSLVTINETFLGSPKLNFGNFLLDKLVATDRNTYSRLNFKNVLYIPLGVDFNKVEEGEVIPKMPKKVVFLGSLEKRKGVDVFISAAKMRLEAGSTLKFYIYTYGKEVRDVSFSSNLEKVRKLVGKADIEVKVGNFDVAKIFGPETIYVQANTSRQGTLGVPLTTLGAVAYGSPCILSNIYALEDIAKHCLIYEASSPKQLNLAIKTLEEKRNLDTADAAKFVRNAHNIAGISKEVYSLYRSLL